MFVYGAGAAFFTGAGAAFFTGAGADPICLEPESAPGPRTSGAGDAKNSGGSATLSTSAIYYTKICSVYNER